MTKQDIEDRKRRKEWLARRKSGIGASDSPNILDLTTWGSALSVYLDKIGESDDFDITERMEIGLDIEDTIVKIFKKRTGLKVHRITKELWSKDHSFLFATPDGRVVGQRAGIECKNIGIYDKSKWEGNIPDQYMIQCQHGMLVTGYDKWYLAALFSGNRFEYYEIHRDQELIDMLISKLTSFWKENVLKRVIPSAQSTDSEILTSRFPEGIENDPPIKFGKDVEEILKEYDHAKQMAKNYTRKKDECANLLKQKLGDNKFGWTNRHAVSWSRWDVQKIDADRLKDEKPDIYKDYLKSSKTGRINISDRKHDSNML